MSENRTFVAVVFGAMGFWIGHFALGADWICALCLAVSFAGLARGLAENRPEDAVLHGAMILLFPLIAAAFPRLWSVCADAIAKGGRTLDATDRHVLAALLFIVIYAAIHLAMRMLLASVLSLEKMREDVHRTVVRASVVAAHLFVAFLGAFAACWACRRFFAVGVAHYVAVGAIAAAWLALALRRFAMQERVRDAARVEAARAEAASRVAPDRCAPSVSVRPKTTFADVAGMEEAKRQIRLRLIDPIKDRVRAQRYGIKPGGGILLYGPPGTGKTLLAKAVAGELDLPFFSITAADIFGKLVGDSEKNVRKLFKEVRRHPLSVVFIDELETIFPNRSVDVHETTRKVVAYMLQELDGIDTGKNPILLLGATNVPWMVDEAFLRPGRFDVKLFVGLPDSDARKAIVDRLFSQGSVRPVPGLAEYISKRTENFSGADLKGIVDGIRQLAYERHLPLYTHALADEVLENAAPSPAESIMDAIRKWEARI